MSGDFTLASARRAAKSLMFHSVPGGAILAFCSGKSIRNDRMVEDITAQLRAAIRLRLVVRFRAAGSFGRFWLRPHILFEDQFGVRVVAGPASPEGLWSRFDLARMQDVETTTESF